MLRRAGVAGIALVAVVLSGELVARSCVAHIRREAPASWLERFEIGSELLVEYRPRGRRLIPGARAVLENAHWSGLDVPFRVNSHGFRGPEIRARKPPGALRILVLGDSITEAGYLPEAEAWVARAEHHLREAAPRGPVELVNAGLGNAGLQEEIDILEDRGLVIAPDVVLVGFYLNDGARASKHAETLSGRGWLRRHSVLGDWAWSSWYLGIWARRTAYGMWRREIDHLEWRTDRADFAALVASASVDWGATWQILAWPPIEQQLGRLLALARQHGFRVALVAFPVRFQVEADFLDATPQQRLARRLEVLGVPHLDLLPMLRARRAEDLFYDHCHPTARGHELTGRAVADFVRDVVAPGHFGSAAPGIPE